MTAPFVDEIGKFGKSYFPVVFASKYVKNC